MKSLKIIGNDIKSFLIGWIRHNTGTCDFIVEYGERNIDNQTIYCTLNMIVSFIILIYYYQRIEMVIVSGVIGVLSFFQPYLLSEIWEYMDIRKQKVI